MYQELSRVKVDFWMLPEDSIRLTYTPYDGTEQIILEQKFTEKMHVTVCKICSFTNMFGLKNGYVGVFGTE